MYIGFWKRFGAYLIDYLILSAGTVVFLIVWVVIAGQLDEKLSEMSINEDTKSNIIGGVGVVLLLSISWLYYAIFESSKFRATIGKMAIGVIVVDRNSERISFARASLRYWCKIISIIPLFFGYIMAGFTPKKQALHDMISNTYVVSKENIRFGKESR